MTKALGSGATEDLAGASDEAYQRFAREVTIARRLTHRNIVRVVDAGSDDDGLPFLVMEMLHGTGLRDLVKATVGLDSP